LGAKPGHSASDEQSARPVVARQIICASQVVDSMAAEAQHTSPSPHWAEVVQASETPPPQVCPAGMQVGVGAPPTSWMQHVCMPAKQACWPQGMMFGGGGGKIVLPAAPVVVPTVPAAPTIAPAAPVANVPAAPEAIAPALPVKMPVPALPVDTPVPAVPAETPVPALPGPTPVPAVPVDTPVPATPVAPAAPVSPAAPVVTGVFAPRSRSVRPHATATRPTQKNNRK
jgi:hypothetical protein